MAGSPMPGFYGKVFTHGDFVDRRLPREFIDVWHGWLEAAIVASREQLGGEWLDIYLNSPIWRFGLSPGIAGDGSWAGVLMPSVDKAGRHYPLILAAAVNAADELPHLFGSAEGAAWFADLEQLALSCLNDGFDLDAFDRSLQACPPPRFAPSSLPTETGAPPDGAGRFARHVGMQSLEQVSAALLDVDAALLRRFLPAYSLWSSSSEQGGASLLVEEGLPPVEAYAALLTGRGWAVESAPVRLPQPPGEESAPVVEADAVTRPRPRPEPAHWRSWGMSVVGKKRKINEDALLERAADGLWAVADGMGGHHAGDVASSALVEALSAVAPSRDISEFARRAAQAVQEVNSRLFQMAQDSGEADQVIGSTAVVLLAVGSRCVFLWAGDSRLYRYRNERLEQLTQDHSLFEDFARSGVLTPTQLAESGRCDTITRAVGAAETLALEQGECDAQVGDLYLLCSDGVDKELACDEIQSIIRTTPVEAIAAALIEQAEERGARDNVTAIIAGLLPSPP